MLELRDAGTPRWTVAAGLARIVRGIDGPALLLRWFHLETPGNRDSAVSGRHGSDRQWIEIVEPWTGLGAAGSALVRIGVADDQGIAAPGIRTG